MLADPISAIRPTSIDSYYDTLQVWLDQSIDISELKKLAGFVHCHDPKDVPLRRIRGRWWRCLNVNQPEPLTKAVNWLRRHRAYLSRVDRALDWTFQTEPEHIEAAHLLNRHYVQKYARNPDIVYFKTHYAKPRRYANGQLVARNTVRYHDKPNRFTGEDYCIHHERRFTGRKILRSIGIYGLDDLLTFDDYHFWSNDFTCYMIDSARLGLAIYNYDHRTDCRRPHQCDIELGKHLATHFSLDQIVCAWRRHIHIRDYLQRLDTTHLLPAPTLYTEDNTYNSTDTPLPFCSKRQLNRYEANTTHLLHPGLFNPSLLDPFKPETRADFRRRYHFFKQTKATSPPWRYVTSLSLPSLRRDWWNRNRTDANLFNPTSNLFRFPNTVSLILHSIHSIPLQQKQRRKKVA